MQGSLEWCQHCGEPLDLVDGTDPDVAKERGGFEETYRCSNGHEGQYEYRYENGVENLTGACRARRVGQVIRGP